MPLTLRRNARSECKPAFVSKWGLRALQSSLSSNTLLAILRQLEREKSASASKWPTSAAVAIIGYPCHHVPYVPLSGAAFPPRDNPYAANYLRDNPLPLIAAPLCRSTEPKPNR